jgi:hypothetical protein
MQGIPASNEDELIRTSAAIEIGVRSTADAS